MTRCAGDDRVIIISSAGKRRASSSSRDVFGWRLCVDYGRSRHPIPASASAPPAAVPVPVCRAATTSLGHRVIASSSHRHQSSRSRHHTHTHTHKRSKRLFVMTRKFHSPTCLYITNNDRDITFSSFLISQQTDTIQAHTQPVFLSPQTFFFLLSKPFQSNHRTKNVLLNNTPPPCQTYHIKESHPPFIPSQIRIEFEPTTRQPTIQLSNAVKLL